MVYVINFYDCPLIWVSKLQIQLYISNLHSDYVALSRSLRGLLPLNDLFKEVIG